MKLALDRIYKWDSFPEAELRDGTKCSYLFAYGSNGERDYMRALAKDALGIDEVKAKPTSTTEEAEEIVFISSSKSAPVPFCDLCDHAQIDTPEGIVRWLNRHSAEIIYHEGMPTCAAFYLNFLPPESCNGPECWIYVMRQPAHNLIKIGITGSLEQRRKAVEMNSGFDTEVIWSCLLPDTTEARVTEKSLHSIFSSNREKGEWFKDLTLEQVVDKFEDIRPTIYPRPEPNE